MEINVLSTGGNVGIIPDAGALDDFEGLGINDASPEYGADAEDSDAGSPSVEGAGAGEDTKLREEVVGSSPSSASSPNTPDMPLDGPASSAGPYDGVVDVKAPIEDQESVGIPEPIEIEVSDFSELTLHKRVTSALAKEIKM